jgi:hypothetical protein
MSRTVNLFREIKPLLSSFVKINTETFCVTAPQSSLRIGMFADLDGFHVEKVYVPSNSSD